MRRFRAGKRRREGGALTFMVGCNADVFASVEDKLKPMAKAIIRAGDHGAGQAAKICNNMLLGISMIGTCEAIAMAEKLGLDPQSAFSISRRKRRVSAGR